MKYTTARLQLTVNLWHKYQPVFHLMRFPNGGADAHLEAVFAPEYTQFIVVYSYQGSELGQLKALNHPPIVTRRRNAERRLLKLRRQEKRRLMASRAAAAKRPKCKCRRSFASLFRLPSGSKF